MSGQPIIQLRIGGRLFAPRWVPTLVTLVLLPALLALGFWQLDRAEQKRVLQQRYDSLHESPALRLDSRPQDADAIRFHRVSARGQYLPRYQILVDNRVQDGRIGYHVLTPLLIDGGDTVVLVNRGWVAQGADRQQLPVAEPPAGPQAIEGVATLPSRPGLVMFRAVAGEGWQTLWQYPDLDHYRKLVPHAVQPVVVLLDPAPEYGPLSRQWVRLDAGIATNEGYALTWFSMAVALLAIYLVVNLHKINAKDHEDRLE